MKGKNKERKLIVRQNEELLTADVVEAVKRYGSATITRPTNLFYRDTYYDDSESSLLKQGGSLKIREGVDICGSRIRKLVMRTRTTHPKKMEFTDWDEVEIGTTNSSYKIPEIFYPLQGFFTSFDFEKINPTPILKCSTYRTQYVLYIDGTALTMMFDHIGYEAHGKVAEDDLLKIRTKSDKGMEIVDNLYAYLTKEFSQYDLVYASRYERALQRLNS